MKILYLLVIVAFCVLGCMTSNESSELTEEDARILNIKDAQTMPVFVANVQTIDLNNAVSNQSFKAYELVDTMFFIPLQTLAESVFFRPYRMCFGNERIYIEDTKFNMVIFDINGNYVNSLTKGEGPGEISSFVDFALDERSQNLVVLQADRFFSYYDRDGNFLRKEGRCPVNTYEFFIMDWGYMFYQCTAENYHLGNEDKYSLFLTNDSLNVVYKGIGVVEGYHYVHCGGMIFNRNDSYYISQFFNDTIYEVNKKNLLGVKVKYVLDYSKKKATNDDGIQASDKFYNSSCVIENSETQIFRFWSPRRGLCHVIRDKSTGKVIGGTQVQCMTEILPEYFDGLMTVYDDYFVSFIPSYKGMHYDSPAVSEVDNQKIAGRDEEDNYVLAFFKFKEIK